MENDFQTKGYTTIKGAIAPDFIVFLTQYCFFKEAREIQEQTAVCDPQSPGQYASYGDAVMETLLLSLQPAIEEATGLSLIPTYSYFRNYRNNSTLVKHKDRESCEISATLCINYDYSTKNYSWPIYMGGTKIDMEPGDCIVYKGCEIEHWREPLTNPLPSWHLQTFLHYVDANGPYTEFKYDKRESLGLRRSKPETNSKKSYIIQG